ncbi:MAG: efflux RND transporter periplasmic adaptor subunit [Chitinophagales bacterium]|nr:efflux RND transporter periplasmic adaptor subunit [Hyphomicrobiales bacterium]
MGKVLGIAAVLIIAAAGGYYALKGNPFTEAAKGTAERPAEGGERRGSGAGNRQGAPRAAPVEVALARKGTSTDDLWSVGSLRSDESVQVSSEVTGRIADISFREGEQVKTGAVLIKLDDALANAEVADTKARVDLAQSNFDRAQSLSKSGSGTEKAFDEATSALATAKATLQLAETRLSKLSITAPFDGRVGLRDISVGAYATPGAAIVNLEKIDVLKLDFRLPETVLTQVSNGQMVELTVDAFPGRIFTGEVYAIDPQVDVNGRSLRIRARISNADLALRPGLFVRVIIKGLQEREVVRVPESAVVPAGNDKIVYSIVGGKAKENKVTLGRRRAGEVEILSGVEDGIQVITAGQTRLRDGAPVDVTSPPLNSAQRS